MTSPRSSYCIELQRGQARAVVSVRRVLTLRDANVRQLYEGLAFVSRQSRELGAHLHPELPLVAHSLLMFIGTEPGARAVDVAFAYGLDKSTVSRQIAQLEEAGMQTQRRAVRSSQITLAAHLRDWDNADLADLARLLAQFVETSRRVCTSGEEPSGRTGRGTEAKPSPALLRAHAAHRQ